MQLSVLEFLCVFALDHILLPTIRTLIWSPVVVDLSACFGLRGLRLCSSPTARSSMLLDMSLGYRIDISYNVRVLAHEILIDGLQQHTSL